MNHDCFIIESRGRNRNMSEQNFRFIVLTGSPGCGKTTLVKKVCSVLREKNFTLKGFYTEEIRRGRERVGFDVVLLDGKQAPLARIGSEDCKDPKIGKYAVNVKSFESCVLPIFHLEDKNSILVLDEIGKMEMLSEEFKKSVSKCINNKEGVIFATVPEKVVKAIPLVELIKKHSETCLLTVNRINRNSLVDKVTNLIISAKKKGSTEQT